MEVKNIPKDAMVNEIQEGDTVVFIFPGYRHLVKGTIVKLNREIHQVKHDKNDCVNLIHSLNMVKYDK